MTTNLMHACPAVMKRMSQSRKAAATPPCPALPVLSSRNTVIRRRPTRAFWKRLQPVSRLWITVSLVRSGTARSVSIPRSAARMDMSLRKFTTMRTAINRRTSPMSGRPRYSRNILLMSCATHRPPILSDTATTTGRKRSPVHRLLLMNSPAGSSRKPIEI